MKKYRRCIALMMLLCGMLPAGGCAAMAKGDNVQLYCLNIGKADCMILSCADQYFLIDTGYEHTYAALETALEALGIRQLNGVFLTHCHRDHEGGLEKLAGSDIAIDHFYASSIYHDVKEKKHPALLAAKERDMEVDWLESGDIIEIRPGYAFSILGPVHEHKENENNNSLVMHFSSPHGSILFTGDMKDDEENDLMDHGLLLPCDILKVAHHGDNGATSSAFLRATTPRTAIILTHTGQEKDTPSPKTMSRLLSAGCDVYVSQNILGNAYCFTLENGNITVDDVLWPTVPKRQSGLELEEKDGLLVLKNISAEVIRFSGCSLCLFEKDEIFLLDDINLLPGQTLVFGNRKAGNDADIHLDTKELLDDKKQDAAILYDAFGRILTLCNNGID